MELKPEFVGVAEAAQAVGASEPFVRGLVSKGYIRIVLRAGSPNVSPWEVYRHTREHHRRLPKRFQEPVGYADSRGRHPVAPAQPAVPAAASTKIKSLSVDVRREPYEDSDPADCYSLCEAKLTVADGVSPTDAEEIGAAHAAQLVRQHATWPDLLVKVIIEPFGLEISQASGDETQSVYTREP